MWIMLVEMYKREELMQSLLAMEEDERKRERYSKGL
jgi:hypothetical protein